MKRLSKRDFQLNVKTIGSLDGLETSSGVIGKTFNNCDTEADCKTVINGTCNSCEDKNCATNPCATKKNCDTIMNECPANTKDDRCHPYSRYGTQCCITVGVMECEQSIEVCPLTKDEICLDTNACSGNEDCLSEIYCHVTQDNTCECAQPIE